MLATCLLKTTRIVVSFHAKILLSDIIAAEMHNFTFFKTQLLSLCRIRNYRSALAYR